ncbi:sn-glycerol-3-phosphate ABC transporter permease UgpE [Actinobacillus genomosp. 1]|uniref:sn-glycerol-3-phosphate ABC transporter permease UgpE n=1 Tax=Actinobacillus genomosp. 1 TaxID=254839 RepID=UPI0024428D37|nr:sn-glycerol-3-phosphate ABC transporter permease UgpE [Actinobacillus genomosp. 1]WGE35384.1 sn-glycerol-3-phosphate ABC transporter permease UgpE [Actinobacillus genomosp. 1]
MVENRPWLNFFSHCSLWLAILLICFPIYLAFIASTHTATDVVAVPISLVPGDQLIQNYTTALVGNDSSAGALSVSRMLWVTFTMTLLIAIGKISISLLSAFAIVYFRFPLRGLVFGLIFVTLMLPVEVRIIPTYEVVVNLGMINSYAGLTIPLIASATATFLFRQFFATVPQELLEASKMDGAKAMTFFKDILVPLSIPSIAALFVIQFIYGWNQYLWPLLMTTSEEMFSLGIGLRQMIDSGGGPINWNIVMASVILMLIPPTVVILLMQKWLVKGLIDSEK